MSRADLYALLALAAIIGAVVATIVAWWYVDQARRTALANADKRHKQDLAEARRSHEADYADLEANRDQMLAGWRDEYNRSTNLEQRLADEQRRLDLADRQLAALRGHIADLQDTIADYARAWGQVPAAWRTDVVELERVSRDDVWAPELEPSPVLVGLLADAVRGEAPGLPDEWQPESFTAEWNLKTGQPVKRRNKYKAGRRAVAR